MPRRLEVHKVTAVRTGALVSLVGLGIAAIVFALVRWVPFGEYPGDAFFDLAAQTIPILLVALAVEAQARRFDSEDTSRRIRIAAVIFLALGETAAVAVAASLYVPYYGTLASDILIVVTAVGLLGGFFAVIAVALRTPPGSSHAARRLIAFDDRAPTMTDAQRRDPLRDSRRQRPRIVLPFIGVLISMAGMLLIRARD